MGVWDGNKETPQNDDENLIIKEYINNQILPIEII